MMSYCVRILSKLIPTFLLPMDIKILDYPARVTSIECIQCLECVNACPTTAIKATFRFDISFKEYLRVQEAS